MPTRSPQCDDDVDAHIGRCVRVRRLELGLTQKRLADAVGIAFQQIYKYEKGIDRIAASRLQQIAEALGVSAAVFYPTKTGAPLTNELSKLVERRDAIQVLRWLKPLRGKRRAQLVEIVKAFANGK